MPWKNEVGCYGHRLIGREIQGTDNGSCEMADFGISGVETSGCISLDSKSISRINSYLISSLIWYMKSLPIDLQRPN
jgi:hypothetical protein